jgi:hypothetical protein
MTEKDLLELHAAIADNSLMHAAGLRTLLRYDRTISSGSNDIAPDFVAELHHRIIQKLITFAAATVIIASIAAGIIVLLH